MATGNYSPCDVKVIWGGHEVTGFASGTFVNAERNADSFNEEIGSCGFVQRVRNGDTTCNVTITLMQGSASNDFFSAQFALDEETMSGSAPLLIQDLQGRTIISAADCWIKKPAAGAFADTQTNRAWTFKTGPTKGSFFIGGSTAARSAGEAA